MQQQNRICDFIGADVGILGTTLGVFRHFGAFWTVAVAHRITTAGTKGTSRVRLSNERRSSDRQRLRDVILVILEKPLPFTAPCACLAMSVTAP